MTKMSNASANAPAHANALAAAHALAYAIAIAILVLAATPVAAQQVCAPVDGCQVVAKTGADYFSQLVACHEQNATLGLLNAQLQLENQDLRAAVADLERRFGAIRAEIDQIKGRKRDD